MSGRLIILPKKTYCPWKPENVERVLRDERLERERIEKEEEEQRQQESKQRLATLKGNDASSSPQKEQHVNLFELEERAVMEPAKKKPAASTGVMPIRLDSVVKDNKDQPFYVRISMARNDDKCKARMDPMKAFSRGEPSRARQSDEASVGGGHKTPSHKNRHRKRSSREHDSSSEDSSDARQSSRRNRRDRKRKNRRSSKPADQESDGSKPDSIEELRRRRQQREQKESQREAALRQQAGTRNDRSRHYQDQFHPSLSRR